MSKIPRETLMDAINTILTDSKTPKEGKKPGVTKKGPRRKFRESVELQVTLKNYDPQRDKRFSGTVRLKFIPKPSMKVCILGDQAHCDEAKALGLDNLDVEALKKMNKNKKILKKLTRTYSAFLASDSLIKQIPKILGPALNKAGKFPSVITHSDNMQARVEETKATIKFQMKKVLCLGTCVGHVEMLPDELASNITMGLNFLVSLLKKQWQNIRSVNVKSSMGKVQRIY